MKEAAGLFNELLDTTGFLASMQQAAWSFSATFVTIANGMPSFVGSATFVLSKGRPYALTAAHVWSELRNADSFALKYQDGRDFLVLRPEDVRVRALPERLPRTRSDWTIEGPDLALVELPGACVPIIESAKSFYVLEDRPSREPESAGLGVWGVLGVPDEMTRFVGPNRQELCAGLFHSFVVHKSRRGDLDYIDIHYDRDDAPAQPRSYGGVSGGGIWHAIPGKDATWSGALSLEGVAYWQEPKAARKGIIRCHGRCTLELLVR